MELLSGICIGFGIGLGTVLYLKRRIMITLRNIKALLITAGISQLKIDFDDEEKQVKVEYVFKGIIRAKQIAYQEIIDSLTIGSLRAPVCPVLDGDKQLK